LPSGRTRPRTARASSLALVVAVLFVIGQLPFPLSASASSPNPVVVWNGLTTSLGLGHGTAAPYLARDYTLVQVAIWDALQMNLRGHSGTPPRAAIVAGAASEVLAYLFPTDATQISATESGQLASIAGYNNNGQVTSGSEIGHDVGKKVVAYAMTDGFDALWNGAIPSGPCKWTGANPIGPALGEAKTFILSSPSEFQPPPPYACGSPQDLADVQAVIDAQNNLTPEEVAIVHKWADMPPPTIWNNMLDDRIRSHSLSILDSARASVYLNVGIYDAFLSCWDAKYTYWTARPFQRMPGFVPVIPTPNFPSYVSGHSTISSTASLIMGQLFPEDAGFFLAQAQEAAVSRLWAGIHFPQDNNNGFALGAEIGAKVVNDMRAPIHPFVFPSGQTS